ncbi:MAG: hypothetical protein AAF447_06965 [Myxococcota bacterium]
MSRAAVLGLALGGQGDPSPRARDVAALYASLRASWTSRRADGRPRVEVGGGAGFALVWRSGPTNADPSDIATNGAGADAPGDPAEDPALDPSIPDEGEPDEDEPDETMEPDEDEPDETMEPSEAATADNPARSEASMPEGADPRSLQLAPFLEATSRVSFTLRGTLQLHLGSRARLAFFAGRPRASVAATLGLAWEGPGWR